MPDVRYVKAVVWDFDGTLVDTEPIWAAAEIEMVAEFGYEWTDEHLDACVGQHASHTTARMAEVVGRPDLAGWFFEELHERVARTIRENDLPFLPGVRDLIAELAEMGIRSAVVTASSGRILEAARDRLPASLEFILTADDVTHTKPHPEPYLQAFERLDVTPQAALVLEDSQPGVRSALDAGAYVIGVPQKAVLALHPRLRILDNGLAGIDLAALLRIRDVMQEEVA